VVVYSILPSVPGMLPAFQGFNLNEEGSIAERLTSMDASSEYFKLLESIS
jgi:hypothetical protein